MTKIIVIAHNIRSTYNIGSIFRTCDGFGVEKIVLSGYTPYPKLPNDTRLPHIRDKITKQIHKTALGAELTVPFNYQEELNLADPSLAGYQLIALEQHPTSIGLKDFTPPAKVALLIGEEVNGIADQYLAKTDKIIEIPMQGAKESFNVSVATGIALFWLST